MKDLVGPMLGLVALATVLGSIGCGDRRPVWSIEQRAIDSLPLEEGLERARALPAQWPEPGCQMVITAGSREEVPPPGAGPEPWRAWLARAEQVDLGCVGQCRDGSKCLPHHRVALANNETGETRCACTPQDAPPCALTVEWGLGTETRRAIRRIWCERGDGADEDCGLLLVAEGDTLELTCRSPSERNAA